MGAASFGQSASSLAAFAMACGVPQLTINSVIGTSLFASMEGAAVRDACRRLHASVCRGRRPVVAYEYRCDAPDMKRRMRMSISPVTRPRGPIMALYQSQIVDKSPRLPFRLLSSDRRAAAAGRHPGGEQVALCSFCHDIAWPIGIARRIRSGSELPNTIVAAARVMLRSATASAPSA